MHVAGFKNLLSSRSGRYPTEDDRDVRAGQTLPSAGTGDSGAKATERADRQEAHGAAHAGHGDGCKTEVGEGVCKWSHSSTYRCLELCVCASLTSGKEDIKINGKTKQKDVERTKQSQSRDWLL